MILDVYQIYPDGTEAKKPFKNVNEMIMACDDPDNKLGKEINIRAYLFEDRNSPPSDVWEGKRNYRTVVMAIEDVIQRHFINGEFKNYSKLLSDWKLTTEVPTAATNGWRVYFNPEFAQHTADMLAGKTMERLDQLKKESKRGKLRLAQITEAKLDVMYNGVLFVFVHEVFHQVYMHMQTEKAYFQEKGIPQNYFNHLRANIAQDKEINRDIVRWYPRFKGMRALIGGCWDDQPEKLRIWTKIFEQDANDVSDIQPPMGNGGGGQGGQQGQQSDQSQQQDGSGSGQGDQQDGSQQGQQSQNGQGGQQGQNQQGQPGQQNQQGSGGQSGQQQDGQQGDNQQGGGGQGQQGQDQKDGDNQQGGSSGGQGDQQDSDNKDGKGGSGNNSPQSVKDLGDRDTSDGMGGHDPFSNVNKNNNSNNGSGNDSQNGDNSQNSQNGNQNGNNQSGNQDSSQDGSQSGNQSSNQSGQSGSQGGDDSSSSSSTPGQGMGNQGKRSQDYSSKRASNRLDVALGSDVLDDEQARRIDKNEGYDPTESNQTADAQRELRDIAQGVIKKLEEELGDEFRDKIKTIKDQLDESIIDWVSILKKVFRSAGVKPTKEEKRKNARMAYKHPAYHLRIEEKPVKEKVKNTSDVFYLADASGSMGTEMFNRFFSEVLDLEFDSGLNIRKSSFAYWADHIDVKDVVTWNKNTPKSKKMELITKGTDFSGGTDLALAVFSAIELKKFYSKANPETVLIVYTDGEVFDNDWVKVASLGEKFLKKLVFIIVNKRKFLESVGARLLELGVPAKNIVLIDKDQSI